MHRSAFLPWILIAIAGCAGRAPTLHRPPSPPVGTPGDPAGSPSLEVLPTIPEGSMCDTVRTHQGLLLTQEALSARLPDPPEDRSHGALQDWAESSLVGWMGARRERIERVKERFAMEGELSSPERVVRHAVLGLLHEDTALKLSALPVPSELDSEPEIRAIYADVLRAESDPFLGSAMREFRGCTELADDVGRQMGWWAEFCRQRLGRLRADVRARRAGPDETDDGVRSTLARARQ